MDYNKLLNKKINNKLKIIFSNPLKNIPSLEEAIKISLEYKVPLHPSYILYWNELTTLEFLDFLNYLKDIEEGDSSLKIYYKKVIKKFLEVLGVEHEIKKEEIDKITSEKWSKYIKIDEINSRILLSNLNIKIKKIEEFKKEVLVENIADLEKLTNENLDKKVNEILSEFCDYEIRDKGGTYIGCRMGRPEKAKMRKLDGKPYGLFPVGEEGGRLRNVIEAYQKKGKISTEVQVFYCPKCSEETIYKVCDKCGERTNEQYFERYTFKKLNEKKDGCIKYKKIDIDIERYLNNVRKILQEAELPNLIKGVRGITNRDKIVEHLVKAILRVKNEVYVNKDGTVRYDMTEMGITHFKPKEIGTSIEKLKELGYEYDYKGNKLENEDQILEIFPQDVILPDCPEGDDETCSSFIIKTGNFVDDLLEKLYKLPRFYNFKTKEDTIGHLVIGLAPHTSAGIIGRIIGYSKTQGCFSHPMWHAAQRRNLDGDENGIILLLDGLINFSKEFLPDRRGAKTMDAPLVLTSHLYPDQIDDEVHGMDIVEYYDLNFYRAVKEYKSPKGVKVEKIENRIDLKDDNRYLNMFFTHDIDDFNDTVLRSSYKTLPTMAEKLDAQIKLAEKIRAVNEDEVASLIIDKHFMKDIKGNLRKFSMQTFRCTNCNEKYRRPPLNGTCVNCGKKSINFTISEGFIKKYLEPSFKLVREYNVNPYIKETLELANLRVESLFGKEESKQKSLNDFFK